MAAKDLSEDILIEIFSRLPAKSVGKCRCLSKFWSTYLSTIEFVQKHLITRQKALFKQENLIFVKRHPPYSLVTITSPLTKHEVSREVVNLSNEWDSIVGSCNGLVLLATQQRHKLLLINAVTLQQVNIPRSFSDYELLGIRQVEWFCVGRSFGFGYDHVNDDYKIVSISLYNNDVDSERDTFIEVYSVKKGVWKSVENKSSVQIVLDSIRPGVLVNGSVHWPTGIFSTSTAEAHSLVIPAFDLATESFHAIHLPDELPSPRKKIFSLGGCLCMAVKVSRDMIELWMMKEYGVVESWCNFRICANGLGDAAGLGITRGGFELLCFAGDVNVLGVNTEYRWSSFELEGTVKEVSIGGGVEANFLDGVAFVDTLVSPVVATA